LVESMESQLGANEFIGIHCTHGVNRTGYMIVRYLVEKKSLKLE
jgi:protein-tyrosine phosphatase